MNLTIIVCTMPERRQLLGRCLWHLENQTCQEFNVIIAHGKGKKGDKINRAMKLVETSHVMVCDDDDWIAQHHVETVLSFDEDFVGYDALQMVHGRYAETIHQEVASHICPIRTEIAQILPFGNEYLADIKWTKSTAKFVKSSTYIDQALYFYDKWNERGVGEWSPPRQVGYWPHNKMNENWRWI